MGALGARLLGGDPTGLLKARGGPLSCLLHIPRGWLNTHKSPSLSSPRGLSLLHVWACSTPVLGVSPDPGERLLLALQGCASLKQPPKSSPFLGQLRTILSTLPGGHGHILGSCEPAGAKMPPLVGSRALWGSQRDHCMGLAVPGGALCHGARLPGGPGRALWVRGLRVGTLRVPRGALLLHTAARSLRAAGGGNRRGAGGCTRAGAAAMESPR